MERIHAVLPDGRVVKDVEVFRRLYEAVGLGWVSGRGCCMQRYAACGGGPGVGQWQWVLGTHARAHTYTRVHTFVHAHTHLF